MPQQNNQTTSQLFHICKTYLLSTTSRSECLPLHGSTHLQNNITKREIFIFESVSVIRVLENFLEGSRNYVQHEERLRNVNFIPHRRRMLITKLSLRRN